MSDQNNTNNQPGNKVSFSSVRGGVNSKGSPTMALHVVGKHLENLIELLVACKEEANSTGAKIMVQIIPGREYDSGYAYITPKLPREQTQGNNGGNTNRSGGYSRGGQNFKNQNQSAAVQQGQTSAKNFFSNKRVG